MPTAEVEETTVHTFQFTRDELVDAPIEVVFQAVLDEMGPESQMPDGKPMPFKLEAWPGGRWYRDLGDNVGHLWGHVQVIKPPKLLEICGPMPMSYPAINHLQYRLTPEGSGTRVKLTHKAMGMIPREHRDGMDEGWDFWLKRVGQRAMALKNKR